MSKPETAHEKNARLLPKRRGYLRIYVRAIAHGNGVSWREIVRPKTLALRLERMKALRMGRMLGMTFTQIAEYFGVDQTNVQYACRKIRAWIPKIERPRSRCPLCPRLIDFDLLLQHLKFRHRTNLVPSGWVQA